MKNKKKYNVDLEEIVTKALKKHIKNESLFSLIVREVNKNDKLSAD